MPLVTKKNRSYFSIDTGEVAFKTKTPDGDVLSDTYEGYLVDVRFKEDEYQGRPYNKYHFVFKSSLDPDSPTEIVQSGANSVFSSNLINFLIGIEGQYGKITTGLYKPDGKEFIANWVYHNDEKAEWAYSYDQIDKWAKDKYNGDKTALFKDLFENKLKPKLQQQGTMAAPDGHDDESGEQDTENDPPLQGSSTDLNDDFDDLDDDLPF